MLKGSDLGVWRNFLRTQSREGWANTSSRGLEPGQIRDVSMGHSGGAAAVLFTLGDGGRYYAPLSQLNISDAKAIHGFISSSMSGPNMGGLSDMWDYFGEGEESSRWAGDPGASRESGRGRGLDFTSRSPGSSERESSGRPEKKVWADEGKKGMFEWQDKSEEIDPKIDRMVMGWIRENPSNIQDILTGMYGLAKNPGLQGQVLAVREAALEAAEGYPPRKDPKLIGRKIEAFTPSEKNFFAFKQAILNEMPELLKKERKAGRHDKADWWAHVAEKVDSLGS